MRRFGSAAEALAMPLVIRHLPDPALAERYGATVVLVRPDQFVAWAGADGAAEEILGTAMAAPEFVAHERMIGS